MGKGITHTKVVSKLATGSGGGGGGGGDMFAAIYDPAGFATQVLVEPISITYLDFLDLKDGTNNNGNNSALDRLVLGQTYAVSSLVSWGYDSNCRLYVSVVADETGTTRPANVCTLTAPSVVNKVATAFIDWLNLTVEQVVIGTNLVQDQAGSVPVDVAILSNTYTGSCASTNFKRTELNLSSTSNAGNNVVLRRSSFDVSSLTVVGDNNVDVLESTIKNSIITFTPTDGSCNQLINSCMIDSSNITFSDNSSSSADAYLERCEISGILLIIGKNVQLTNCRFIGPGDWFGITIPNGYVADGKTFIYGDKSDFETTIELDSTVSGTTLTLPTAYTDWVGIYRTTNTSGTTVLIDVIDVGVNATHRFKIYGNSTKKIDLTVTNSGGAAAAGNFFVPYTVATASVYTLGDYYDYWEFQKADIEGEPNALRVTDYNTLG